MLNGLWEWDGHGWRSQSTIDWRCKWRTHRMLFETHMKGAMLHKCLATVESSVGFGEFVQSNNACFDCCDHCLYKLMKRSKENLRCEPRKWLTNADSVDFLCYLVETLAVLACNFLKSVDSVVARAHVILMVSRVSQTLEEKEMNDMRKCRRAGHWFFCHWHNEILDRLPVYNENCRWPRHRSSEGRRWAVKWSDAGDR